VFVSAEARRDGGRDEHLPLDRLLRQPLVPRPVVRPGEVRIVLDHVDADPMRLLDSVHAKAVHGDAPAEPMRFIDGRPHLLVRVGEREGIAASVHQEATGDGNLDDVGPLGQALSDRLSDAPGAVDRSALIRHVSARSRQRRASRQDARSDNETALRSTAKIEDRVVRRSDVSNRRHAGSE
jgi:hypothetical protein